MIMLYYYISVHTTVTEIDNRAGNLSSKRKPYTLNVIIYLWNKILWTFV